MPSPELWKSLSTYNNPQLLVALAIVVIVALSIVARIYLVPGTRRLEADEEDRDDAVGILKAENARLIKEKEEAEKREREERHRANNLQIELNGFQWAWKNPMALRQRADEVDEEQRQNRNGHSSN